MKNSVLMCLLCLLLSACGNSAEKLPLCNDEEVTSLIKKMTKSVGITVSKVDNIADDGIQGNKRVCRARIFSYNDAENAAAFLSGANMFSLAASPNIEYVIFSLKWKNEKTGEFWLEFHQ